MNISDNWFTRSMLIDTISRANQLQNQSKIKETALADQDTFLALLQNMLANQEMSTGNQYAYAPMMNVESSIQSGRIQASIQPENTAEMDHSNRNLGYQGSNVERMNQLLGGKLAGMGEVFDQAGKKYNISSGLLAGIAQHETGNGASRAALEKNNIAGMMGKNGLRSYSSVEESIFDMARNLSENYLGKGLNSIAEIGGKYAPAGASNDPTGLNNHWVKGVSKFAGHFMA